MTAAVTIAALVAPPARADDVDLSVTRVAVFNSGVAYYECEATVAGDAVAELSFRTEQVNDILKSLIVQDFDGGTVGVVRYASQDPIDKTLKSFGVDITGKPTLAQLFDQLRGQPVEITGDRAISGVIVGVEQRHTKVGETVVVEDRLNVLTDAGIQQLPLNELRGIRLTNDKVADELRKALAVLATSNDAGKKSVELHFRGSGQRKIRVAYLLEAPIWKTSYRLALDDEKQPFLQGWATVENATEEDWNDVRLSLVAGRPISFRMDLYTPIYIPRPLEELELYASLRPPEFEGAMEADKMDQRAAGRAMAAMAPRGAVPEPEAAQRIPSFAGSPRLDLDFEGSGVGSVATAADAGELFEYAIRTPVSIRRQQSAMLPIVNQRVKGTKVGIYNPATHPKHPLNGLELTNSTDLHLMQGPVTLFDGDIYAGDAKLPDLKPGEERLVAYALDLSTEVDMRHTPSPEQVTAMRIVKGTLIQTRKYVDDREYVIKNKGDRARTVLIEQPYGDDWVLKEPAETYQRTASLSRFKVETPPRETVKQRVRIERIADQTIALGGLYADQMRVYVRSKVISGTLRDALEKAITMQADLEQKRRDRAQAEGEVDEVVKDQGRVRENLRALQANTDAHRRQLEKFDALETKIDDLRDRIRDLRSVEQQQTQRLEDYLAGLNVE
jgi:hypothetical protein